MIVVVLAVQICLWAHAGTLVQAAATDGEQAATALGGSPRAGELQHKRTCKRLPERLWWAQRSRRRSWPEAVSISVSGRAEAIIPWLHLPVSATRVGLSQEFPGVGVMAVRKQMSRPPMVGA